MKSSSEKPSNHAIDSTLARINLQNQRESMYCIYQQLLIDCARRAKCPQFRFCGRCLWRNYHCVLHQVTALTHCPLHPSSLLQTRCPHCEEEMAYHFSARVLDTPFCCAHCRKPYATAKLRRGMGRPFALKTIQVMTKLRHRHRAW